MVTFIETTERSNLLHELLVGDVDDVGLHEENAWSNVTTAPIPLRQIELPQAPVLTQLST